MPSSEAAHVIVCISRQALQTIPGQPLLSTLHPHDRPSLWPGTHKHFPLANHSSFAEGSVGLGAQHSGKGQERKECPSGVESLASSARPWGQGRFRATTRTDSATTPWTPFPTPTPQASLWE